ncbi:MAG TPA: diguanylate cyclase [Candidatus Avalokitesvara rifleensis]|uniref:diguanylate cyclase n=1 Tax=Candidatus Avalokitesvara rifleensis TaxID=3367620 RepID=UPI0040276E0B
MSDMKSGTPEVLVDANEVALRLRYLDLTEQDRALLQEVFPKIEKRIDDVVNDFYSHLLDFDETKALLQEKSTVQRLKGTLKGYLRTAFNCTMDMEYFESRFKIGQAHNNVELRPKWYIGAYSLLNRLIRPIITDAYKDNAEKAIRTMDALDKVFFLDATLAMDSYIHSYMGALEDAYEKIVQEEQEWLDTFDSITDFVSIHDKDFNIVKANRAVYERFKLTKDALGRKKCYEIFHSTDEHWPTCPLVKASESRRPTALEIDDPHMGGVFLISAFPRFNNAGEFTGVIHIAKNVTEKKRLERELEAKSKELEKLAITDSLTGLFNRRRFYELLTSAMAASARYGRPLSLLFFDLDNFKDYNDTYGHLEGDIVLRTVAESAQKLIRQNIDFCGRYGGEEFTITLPDTTKEGALILAERLRREIERLEFHPKTARETSKPVKITVSIGVTEFKYYDADTFIEKADKAMYKAKKLGKNRVVVSE